MHASFRLTALLALGAVGLVPTAVSQTTYTLTALPTVGTGSSGFSINDIDNFGRLVGSGYASPGVSHAYMYYDGTMTDITPSSVGVAAAYGINDNGQVILSGNNNPWIYQNGSWTNLGFGGLSGVTSITGVSINDAGLAVGTSYDGTGANRVVLIDGTTFTDLGNFGGDAAYGVKINNAGDIVAKVDTDSGGTYDTILYSGGSATNIGNLGQPFTYAVGFNDSGEISGTGRVGSGQSFAYLYADGSFQNLGTAPAGGIFSYGRDVNNLGDVVGQTDATGYPDHAFLFTDGTMYDLNDMLVDADGWLVYEAVVINDAGLIGAYATFGGGYYSVLLTPVSAVPEPATSALGVGLAALLLGGWKRRKSAGQTG